MLIAPQLGTATGERQESEDARIAAAAAVVVAVTATAMANEHRRDLQAARIGDRRSPADSRVCEFVLPKPLASGCGRQSDGRGEAKTKATAATAGVEL